MGSTQGIAKQHDRHTTYDAIEAPLDTACESNENARDGRRLNGGVLSARNKFLCSETLLRQVRKAGMAVTTGSTVAHRPGLSFAPSLSRHRHLAVSQLLCHYLVESIPLEERTIKILQVPVWLMCS